MSAMPAALELALPQALWALALVVPLGLFHLYHRRKVVVAFLPLLVEAVGPKRPGGGWRKLRDVLSLLFRAAALLAVVLAMAGLRPARAGPAPESLLLVVDADSSTRAVEPDGRSRYLHALELARAAVLAAPWAEVGVLEARDVPAVLVPRTRDRARAVKALDRLIEDAEEGRLVPGPARASLEAAVAAARREARRRGAKRVRVLTARAYEAPDGERLEVWGTGTTDDDQGVIGFELARDPEGARAILRLRLANRAHRERERVLLVHVGADEIVRRSVAIPAREEVSLELEVQPPRDGAWLRAALEGRDAYADDDAVTAWLPAPLRPSVLVVHENGVRPWTAAVLSALGDAIDTEHSGTVRAKDLARAGAFDVYLVDGVALPKGALERGGSYLFVAPLAGDLPFEVGAPIEEPLVWRSAPDDPLVRDLDLATAWVARGFPVSAPGLHSLAEADGRCVLGEGEAKGVRYVVLGLDPDRSDLPLRAALPLLLRNALRRLAAVPRAPLEPFYEAGRPMRPRLPIPGGPEVRLVVGGRERTARLAREGPTFEVPLGARGEVEVRASAPDARAWSGRTAFVDLREDLDVAPARPEHERPEAARPRRDDATRWRRALLALALLLLLLDLFVLGRLDRRMHKLAPGHGQV